MIDPEMTSPNISPGTAFNLKNESKCLGIQSMRSIYNVINAGFLQALAHTRFGCRPFHFYGQTSVETDPHIMEAFFTAHAQHASVYRAYCVMQIGGRTTRRGSRVVFSDVSLPHWFNMSRLIGELPEGIDVIVKALHIGQRESRHCTSCMNWAGAFSNEGFFNRMLL